MDDMQMPEMSPVGKPKPKCKLVGIDGNAFMIMGAITSCLKKNGYTKEEISQYRELAMSSDYDNLLQESMKWVDAT